jgi:hypothetical protein
MLSVCPLGAVLPPKAADRSIEVITGAEPRTGASCGLSSTADKFWQIWNVRLVRDAEISPECDAELGGGAHQSEECIAAVVSICATNATTDLSLGDMEADVALGAIDVEGYLRPIEHPRNSGSLACSRDSRQSSVTKPVRRWKMQSNRACSSPRRRTVGAGW